jgi:hypothetical protein
MTRRGFSARVGAVAFMCAVLMVTMGATTAGATTTTTTPGHAAPFTAKLGPLNPDPTCPHAPDFPEVNFRQNFAGLAKTRIGPAIIANTVCYIFDGAMGGSVLKGAFALHTIAGTLRGTSSGVVGHGANDHFQLTLTVTSGTLFLSHVRGTITLDARTTPDWSRVTGTLTSGLYFPWGWGHRLPIPLT